MAMGAHTRDVLGMVVGRGMTLTLVGVAIGWLTTWGVSRLLASLLFEIEILDVPSYVGATVVLVLRGFRRHPVAGFPRRPHRSGDRAPIVSRFPRNTSLDSHGAVRDLTSGSAPSPDRAVSAPGTSFGVRCELDPMGLERRALIIRR